MQDNTALIRAVFESTARADGRPFIDAMADDCVWRAMGAGSWSGDYVGKADILGGLLGPLGKRIEGGRTRTIASRIHGAGDFVIVEAEGSNRTIDGSRYDNRYCFVIRMRDGGVSANELSNDVTLFEGTR